MISKVLVANRGEIAVRIIRACFDEGVVCVAALSAADLESLPAKLADEVVCIGPANAAFSYLSVERQIAAALLTRCDAIHPGYGFLSENPALAEECRNFGVEFIGPSADAIRRAGDKVEARRLARSIGVPVASGSDALSTSVEALSTAQELGFPLLLKAAGGGGGKGMRQVFRTAEVVDNFELASAEAKAAFGDSRIYLERYVENARHIEVQVLADKFGRVVHLGDRDCTLQRRFQKVLEEAPATIAPEHVRKELRNSAVAFVAELGYEGAATVEFLYDLDRQDYFFLEVNTRVQVEHPVTEAVTGIDIVRQQLRIASGEPLGFQQSDVKIVGHAVECRVNAESVYAEFTPSPGCITDWVTPVGDGIRVDTHCFSGYTVPANYDSLLAKLICYGNDRIDAIYRLQRALGHFRVKGVETTLPLHRWLVNTPQFLDNEFTTTWLQRSLSAQPISARHAEP